jgi:hypothetical protein
MKHCKVCFTILILLAMSFQQTVAAQPIPDHLVSPEELRQGLMNQSAQRMVNIQAVRTLLHQELVQQQVGRLVDLEKIELALATLDDDTLKQLANESRRVNDQLQAGMATWGWVLIALIAAITIIAVVGAVTWGDSF